MRSKGWTAGWSLGLRAVCVLYVLVAATASAGNSVWRPGESAVTAMRQAARRVARGRRTISSSAEERTSDVTGRNTMRCIGETDYERGCLVHDLYYDTRTGSFTWFGTSIVASQGATPVRAGARAFAAATCAPPHIT